jgi:hypothetical protein
MLSFACTTIIESEHANPPNDNHLYDFQGPLAIVDHGVPVDFADFLTMHAKILYANGHTRLQNDLVEHLWRLKGNTKARS